MRDMSSEFPLAVHPDAAMIEAFRRFVGLPSVAFHACRFEELPAHYCFVTAGNSFGMMTAGIDAAVVAHLGRAVMIAVQRRILDRYLGEQPIGSAFIVETGHADAPCGYACAYDACALFDRPDDQRLHGHVGGAVGD